MTGITSRGRRRAATPEAARNALVVFVTACVLLAPASAFGAVDQGGVDEALAVVERYPFGMTDEGVTVADLMQYMDAPAPVALATVSMVDYWAAMGSLGPTGTKLKAGQLANLAAGVKTYMEQQGTWDSWQDYVGGAVQYAGGVLLDLSPWWDSLGFASLAETRAYGDVSYTNGSYSMVGRSGFLDRVAIPDDAAAPVYTGSDTDFYQGLMHDLGFPMKISLRVDAVHDGSTGWGLLRHGTGTPTWRCAECGWSASAGTRFPVCLWDKASGAFLPPDANWSRAVEHYYSCEYPSETAAMVEALIGDGLPGWMGLAAAAIANPAGTILGAVDSYGVPSVLPPGVIKDALDPVSSWGNDLEQTADDLASRAASMTVDGANLLEQGVGSLLHGFGELVRWVGDFFDSLQAFALHIFTVNGDWLRITVRGRLEAMQADLSGRFPFSIISELQSAVAVFGSAAGSAANVWEFDLPYGVHVDVLALIAPVGRYRYILAGFVYFGALFGVVGMLMRVLGLPWGRAFAEGGVSGGSGSQGGFDPEPEIRGYVNSWKESGRP